MRLLPDINMGSNLKLSIQDPYTINDRLIVDTYIDNDYHGIQIKFKTNDGQYYCCDKYVLENAYNTLRDRNRGMLFFDENERGIRFSESFKRYIQLIQMQCNEFNSSYHFYEGAKNRLRSQGRHVYNSYAVTSDRYSNGYVSSSIGFDDYVDISDIVSIDGRTDRRTFTIRNNDSISFTANNVTINPSIWFTFARTSTYSNNNNEESFIHAHNYKPEYIKHRLENEQDSLLLGVEIEVAGNTDYNINKNNVVKKCIQIMNGSDSVSEDLIYSTSDSTVQIELDTMPCSLEFHKTMNYKEMFKYLDKKGYKGHDCENAGLHIHADRSYLGKTELKQQLVISKILYILEKFNDEICVIARRNNSYSTFVGKEEVNKSLVKLYNKYENTGKRVALNLQHKDSIEFRCFKSTLKYETFILTLEFVQDIINYAKAINIEDIELIQWNDLMDTFSDELKAYYKDRKKKEDKKKKDNSHAKNSSVYSELGIAANELREQLFQWNTALNSAMSNIDDSNVSNVDDPIDTLKKEIKTLKKRIKNCRNYMESVQLKEELNSKQKELKQLKKRNNTNLNNNTDNNNVNVNENNTATISWDLNNVTVNNRIYTTINNNWRTVTGTSY